MASEMIPIEDLLNLMWDDYAIMPTHLFVAPQHERTLMRWKYPKLPHARTANMRRLRKLKYRRHP